MFASERERDPHGDKEKEEEEELYEEEGEWRGVKVEIFPAASGGLSGQTAALRSGKKKHDVRAPPPRHPHFHHRHPKNIPASSSAASTDIQQLRGLCLFYPEVFYFVTLVCFK